MSINEKIRGRDHTEIQSLFADEPDFRGTEGSRRNEPLLQRFGRRLRILIWCNYDALNAATMCDHVNAFTRYSKNEVYVYSGLGEPNANINLDSFDVIVIHYSLALALESYVNQNAKWRLRRTQAIKCLFIQDEYRFVNRTIEAMEYVGIDVAFTCVADSERHKVYPKNALPDTRFENVLTGYVPPWLSHYKPKPLQARRIDVGYRGRTYPAWHGRAGREKVMIGKRFKRAAPKYGLKTDIAWSEKARLYGRAWLDFTRECRSMLAVESGCSVFDYDGSISAMVESYAKLREHRGIIPAFDRRAPYEELRERFFVDKEDLVDLSQISPRVFEAAALNTLLIMYEGRYSGAVEPWRHYVPLKKDHSNMEEVVDFLKDDDKVSEMVSRTYSEVAIAPKYSYPAFIEWFDSVVEEEILERDRGAAVAFKYKPSDFHKAYKFYYVDNPHGQGLPRRTFDRIKMFASVMRGAVRRKEETA